MTLRSFGEFERAQSSMASVEHAFAACERLGACLTFSSAGDAIRTTSCKFVDPTGRASIGRGKGIGNQSVASAIFEALEHHIYAIEPLGNGNVTPLDLDGADRALRDSSPDFKGICAEKNIPLARIPFRALLTDEHDLLFPAFLTNPDYEATTEGEARALDDYRLHRYSTNSGTAAGVFEAEAILHGLLEVIERDAIGIELIRTIFKPKPEPVRCLRLDTFPRELQTLSFAVTEEAECNIELWDITSDLGVATVLCALAHHHDGTKYFGSGSSLSAHYAVERAMLEALQSVHNYTCFHSPRPLFGITDFVPSTLFQRSYLEAGHFEYLGGSVHTSFDSLPNPSRLIAGKGLKEQLWCVLKLLSERNVKPYWRCLYNDGFFVCQVVVPRLERFHLVSQGIPVLPSSRGKSFLSTE